jgi:hypothetical protein
MIKKTFLFCCFLAIFNCSNNEDLNNCVQPLSLNYTTDLNNPQLLNALVPGGYVELSNVGSKGVLLMNVNGNEFIAYDKLCPADACATPMTFDGSFTLKCSCDDSEYGVGKGIGGVPQTEGFVCPAIEYRVIKSGSAIRITNF